jgi:UDP-hydrolysing UDP-N-acetyl-D-glucosamine 2-epimerase
MWPVMRAIQEHPDLELQTVCAGTMLLERFGQPERIVEADGFPVHGRVYMELEGSVPTTMAKSIGFGIVEFASELHRLKPDIVLLIGDRYETLAAAIAAAYQNIPIAHVQGGEVSGSIDESARHAITRFAHFHFPATRRAAEYLLRMGERPDCVFPYGCPCGDYIIPLDGTLPHDVFNRRGIGAPVSPEERFVLVIYHPVTTEFGEEGAHVAEILAALEQLRCPTVWLWPNIDAGADQISKTLRRYREQKGDQWLRLIKNFEPMIFQKVLKRCACAIGNSSSFTRDTTFSGTPVILVGDRQEGRELAENIVAVKPRASDILEAAMRQLAHGRYAPSQLYGDGTAAKKIVKTLAEVKLYTQKRLNYIYE